MGFAGAAPGQSEIFHTLIMRGGVAEYPKIWFLRHGQTVWNAERRIQGRLNSDLTELGKAQALMQRRLMAPFVDDVVKGGGGLYVSPQGRAQQTAELALEGRVCTVDERLAEINSGLWEGRTRDEVAPQGADLEVYAAAPEGEGYEALEARVRDFLNDLTAPAIVVSHGILGKVLRGVILDLPRKQVSDLSNLQGCVYVLENGFETVLHS